VRQILLAGVSVRALAESAARAGYGVMGVDAFSDLDLRAIAVAAVRCHPYSARAAARLARDAPCDTVIYTSNFENDPIAIAQLVRPRGALPGRRTGRERTLWGNPPAVIRRVRNPLRLAKVLDRLGFAVPSVRATAPPRTGAIPDAPAAWLLKPKASGGGQGVVVWHPGEPVPRGCVLQERMRGIPGSIAFAADGHDVVPLALSRQLVGNRSLGATGFRYSGSVLVPPGDAMLPRDAELLARATELAVAVTRAFGLVGVNGIDFIARGGVPYPVEVNPRPTGSMELAERAYGISIFATHVQAIRGKLPEFDLARERLAGVAGAGRGRGAGGAIGKALVYARRARKLPDTTRWLTDQTVRDIPPPGSVIAAGRPICTVFAEGRTGAACLERLIARARRV
jgi:predicted ATP-grasp superfamily ATP-dependent carboligase